jgi:YVTN family beta-propeller protein
VNLKTKAVVRSFSGPTTPISDLLSPNGKELWAVGSTSGVVDVFSTTTGSLLHRIFTGGRPDFLTFNRTHTQVWVGYGFDLAVISTSTYRLTHKVVLPGAWDVVFSKSGAHAYVLQQVGVIFEVGTRSYAIGATPIVVGDNALSEVISKDGKRIYVVDEESIRDTISPGAVTVISTAMKAPIAVVPLASFDPDPAALNPAGTRLYVPNPTDESVSIINTATNTVTSTFTTGTNTGPYLPFFSKGGGFLYVDNYTSGTVSIVPQASKAAATVVFGGPNPVLNAGNRSILKRLADAVPYGATHVTVHIVGYTNLVSSEYPDLARAGATESYLKSLGLSGSYSLACGGVKQREATVSVTFAP